MTSQKFYISTYTSMYKVGLGTFWVSVMTLLPTAKTTAVTPLC